MTTEKQTPTARELEKTVRTAEEFDAAARYQELIKTPEKIPEQTLGELAELMTPEEVIGQLTATIDTVLADGAHSQQRPGVVYKIYEGDATENIPRLTVERDTMAEADGRGLILKYPSITRTRKLPTHRISIMAKTTNGETGTIPALSYSLEAAKKSLIRTLPARFAFEPPTIRTGARPSSIRWP